MEAKKLPCGTCNHWRPLKMVTCPAFPDGLPESIVLGENRHTEILPGQANDFVYSPVEWANNPDLQPYIDPRMLED
jgi:hypothetical protein